MKKRFRFWLIGVIAFTLTASLRAAPKSADDLKPDTPRHALKAMIHKLRQGDTNAAIACFRWEADAEGERDIVRAAVESIQAFDKLMAAAVTKWPAPIDADGKETSLVVGPAMPWDGEADIAKESIDGGHAELRYSKTRLKVEFVKDGDRWVIVPGDYLRKYSSDPADSAALFRAYAKVAQELRADVMAGRIENMDMEQSELKRRTSECEEAAKKTRKHAGQ